MATNNNRVTILKVHDDRVIKVHSLPVMNAVKSMLVVDNVGQQANRYQQYVFIGQGRDVSNQMSPVHVYATHNGNHYSKVSFCSN